MNETVANANVLHNDTPGAKDNIYIIYLKSINKAHRDLTQKKSTTNIYISWQTFPPEEIKVE